MSPFSIENTEIHLQTVQFPLLSYFTGVYIAISLSYQKKTEALTNHKHLFNKASDVLVKGCAGSATSPIRCARDKDASHQKKVAQPTGPNSSCGRLSRIGCLMPSKFLVVIKFCMSSGEQKKTERSEAEENQYRGKQQNFVEPHAEPRGRCTPAFQKDEKKKTIYTPFPALC